MELHWGYILPDGEIIEGSGEFPDHRRLASEYFSAQGDPDRGDPEAVALSSGWVAYVIDAGEFRVKLSRLSEEDVTWPMDRSISAVERLQEHYDVEPVIVTAHMFTAAALERPEPTGEPPRMLNPRRKRNDKYWYEDERSLSWGFVNPEIEKIIDGQEIPGLNHHEQMAEKLLKGEYSGTEATEKLLRDGWVRYVELRTRQGVDLNMGVRNKPRERPGDLIERVMSAVQKIIRHVGMKPTYIMADVPAGYAKGRNAGELRASLEEVFRLRRANPRRKRNDKYWTAGDQIISWGFVHPYESKPADGRTVRGVRSHDELAVKIARIRSIPKALNKLKEEGWIRYIAQDDGGSLEVAVEAYDMPGEEQEAMADRIMTGLRRINNHVGVDPYRFIVDTRHGQVVGYTMSEVRRKLEEMLQPVF